MNDEGPRSTCRGCMAGRLNRRRLLVLAGASTGAAALAAIPGCGNPTGSPITGPVSAGNVSALAVGTLIVMSNFAVARDAGGVYAMSAVCTHAGCLLVDGPVTVASGLACPCHASRFDGNGAVVAGPARLPLEHYLVTNAPDGGITVDGSQIVAADARTPLT
jgi:Rieske Fe-S protein